MYVSDFCLILYVNYRGKYPLLENVTPPRGGFQSSRALSDIFFRVIKIAGQSRILELLKRVATRNFSKKKYREKTLKMTKNVRKKSVFWL